MMVMRVMVLYIYTRIQSNYFKYIIYYNGSLAQQLIKINKNKRKRLWLINNYNDNIITLN